MERHMVFIDWEIQHDKDINSLQINIQVKPIFLKIKIPTKFFRYSQNCSEFLWERKGNNPEKNNKIGGINLSNFKAD